MVKTNDRTQYIELEARNVLLRASINGIPIDLSKVASSLNVNVHYDSLENNVSGVLVVKGQERHAIINADHHPNRQRFSLAHELGHLMLHNSEGDRLFVDTNMRVYQRVGSSNDEAYNQPESTTNPYEEREANRFASALLMPHDLVQREAVKMDLSEETDIAFLGRTFGVSDQAMSIRLQQLGLVQLNSL